jgi:hypothetical protein
MPTLKEVMEGLAELYKSPLVFNEGIYSMEIPVGETGRTQVVNGTVHQDRYGRDVLLVCTRVGEWSGDLPSDVLLELNLVAPYVKTAKLKNHLIACGDQILETCQVGEVFHLMGEVAAFGDFLEEQIFGSDNA